MTGVTAIFQDFLWIEKSLKARVIPVINRRPDAALKARNQGLNALLHNSQSVQNPPIIQPDPGNQWGLG